MATKKTLEIFNVSACLKLEVCIAIKAENFDKAIEKIKTLEVSDFVTAEGDMNDCEITGFCYIGSDYGSSGFKLK